jgi:molybdate transport system substrate-binding protein
MKTSITCITIVCASLTAFAAEPPTVTVYAAASLTNALNDIDANYEKTSGTKLIASFASSSTLAKQIENGAPTDVFISADEQWMDYLARKGKIDPMTRQDLLGNELVLVAPKGQQSTIRMEPKFKFADAFTGKLCTGDPERVPVGIYAKQALLRLGWWNSVASRVVPTEDVRAALLFVERQECAMGIVYATDAGVSDHVQTVATFLANTHDPIVYPVAVVSGEHPAGHAYLTYLSSQAALTVFKKFGFKVLLNRQR